MRLQVWLINFKNVDVIALIDLVFYKALDLVLLINWLKINMVHIKWIKNQLTDLKLGIVDRK